MTFRAHHVLGVALLAAALLIVACSGPGGEPTATPVSATDSVSGGHLLVVGDWGAGTMEQQEVAQRMAEYAGSNPVVRILTTGDNFYSNDSDSLMTPFEWAADSGIPFWVTWGNHDVASGRRIEMVDRVFGNPPRWGLYQWGGIDVIVLDSTQPGSEQQTGFLSRVMTQRDNAALVVFHHPAYSCGPHGSSPQIVDDWLELFDEDVVLVLNGHDHLYERFSLDGVTYVVTGGGGRFLNTLSSCPADHPELIVGEATHHFLALVHDEGLRVTSIAIDGSVVDEFSVAID